MKLSKNFLSKFNCLADQNRYYWAILVSVTLVVCTVFWYQGAYNPDIYYLSDSHNAHWIRDNSSFDVNAKPFKQEIKLFKKNFTVTEQDQKTTLYIKAFKFVRVFIDEQLVYESKTDASNWKVLHKVAVSKLSEGEHELLLMAMNYDGPVAVLAYTDTLPVKTDGTWMVSAEGNYWLAASLAEEPRIPAVSIKFPPAYTKLADTIPIGVLALLCVLVYSRFSGNEKYRLNSEKLRWILLCCWVVLMVNSLLVTKPMGFDMIHHVEYVQFILNNGRLPLATDGLQMFQSPLFYMVSAAFVKLASVIFDIKLSFHLLKIIPLICGIAMVEVCYRCARLAFPDRVDLQCIALLIGAMAPMSLYMSQYLSNEPLLGILSAFCILTMLTWFRNPQLALQLKQQLLLGLVLGLALLAKATAFILTVVVLVGIVLIFLYSNHSKKQTLLVIARVLSVVLIVAGWYYLRNWLLLGKPFVGGWDAGRGLTWWQEPGYRNMENFITFGQALIYPIYAATSSFWDAFYSTLWSDGLLGSQSTFETRPPWNYSYILATVWLSMLPTAGLLVGIIFPVKTSSFDVKTRYINLFCSFGILMYLLAVLYLYFQLPIYSTVKASYSLGLLPCYALLAAAGLSRFMNNKASRSIVATILIWWGVSSYVGYFSVGIAT